MVDQNAIGGWVRPGDHVDVQFTYRFGRGGIGGRRSGDLLTQTVLQDIEVLTVGDIISSSAAASADGSGIKKPVRLRHVTLLVSPEDADTVTLAAQSGHLNLILRSQEKPSQDAPAEAAPPGIFLSKLIDLPGRQSDQPEAFEVVTEELELVNDELEKLRQDLVRLQNTKPQGLQLNGTMSSVAPQGALNLRLFKGRYREDLLVRLPTPRN